MLHPLRNSASIVAVRGAIAFVPCGALDYCERGSGERSFLACWRCDILWRARLRGECGRARSHRRQRPDLGVALQPDARRHPWPGPYPHTAGLSAATQSPPALPQPLLCGGQHASRHWSADGVGLCAAGGGSHRRRLACGPVTTSARVIGQLLSAVQVCRVGSRCIEPCICATDRCFCRY